MLHAFDDRQGHVYALCLGLFVQPFGIALKRLGPSGIDIERRVTGEIVLQRVGQRIKLYSGWPADLALFALANGLSSIRGGQRIKLYSGWTTD